MAKQTNKAEGPKDVFIDNPEPTKAEVTIEVPTGDVLVKVLATGDEFSTSKNNWNSMYKDDVDSEGKYKYELVEEKKKLLS